MKRITLTLLACIMALSCLLSFAACEKNNDDESTAINTAADGEKTEDQGDKIEAKGIWKTATYLSDTTVGNGAKTVRVTVEADGQKLTITLKTDKANLGDALFEHKLINDPSFFNVINGMEASWEKDQAYWAFYEGETMMPYGVQDQKINGGEAYRIVYTK